MDLMKNRFAAALILLMLLSAAVHMILQIAYAIIHLKPEYLNLFSIIGLNFYFPQVAKGAVSQGLSLVITLSLYWLIYFFFTKKLAKLK